MSDERISEAEYLLRERAAEYRSEYRGGRMVAMTGASATHGYIVAKLVMALGARIGSRPCRVVAAELRVKVAASGRYVYPDVVALCGPPVLEDQRRDTLLNPAVIVEVLSPSTEAYDRGEKFTHYKKVASLREYVLVAQARMRVERYARDEAKPKRWIRTTLDGPDAVLELSAIGCAVPLREIYAWVTFDAPAPGR